MLAYSHNRNLYNVEREAVAASSKLSYRKRLRPVFRSPRDFLILNKWRVLKFLLVAMSMLVLADSALFFFLYFYTGDLKDTKGNPLDLGKLGRNDYRRASYLLASNGKDIIWSYFKVLSDPVKLDDVPDLLVKGFIAAEDKRYFSKWHYGIDELAMARATIVTYGNKIPGVKLFFGYLKYKQKTGGSGIAQQYARLSLADEVPEFKTRAQTIWRKVFEAQVATQLVKRYGKKRVLEGFLNSPYFGHGAVGVAEARRRYFGPGAPFDHSKSGLRRVAILTSLNKSPTAYCPIFHQPVKPVTTPDMPPEKIKKSQEKYQAELAAEHVRLAFARARWNWVLERMRDDGYISEMEYQEAEFKKDEPLELDIIHFTPIKEPDFSYAGRTVKEMLLTTGFPNDGFSDDYITEEGGMRIISGIDRRIQEIASQKLADWLEMLNSELPPEAEKLEGAIAIIDNDTNEVAAMVGGINPQGGKPFNRVFARRSLGSGIKPFIYANAIENFNKDFYDKICNCPFTMRGANGKRWSPRNFPERNPVGLGYQDLALGMIKSLNLETLQLARMNGMDSVIAMLHKFGMWGEDGMLKDPDGNIIFRRPDAKNDGEGLDPRLPTAIGASGVSLMEAAQAYSVFARRGIYARPVIIKEIRDFEGKLLYKAPLLENKQVMSEITARKITILARAVTKMGTLQITMRDAGIQAAAKTGTSNGPDDLGVYGFTGYKRMLSDSALADGNIQNISDKSIPKPKSYTIAIRIGYDSPHPIDLPKYMLRASKDPTLHISAGWVVGPLWKEIAEAIYQNKPKPQFPPEIDDGTHELLQHYNKDVNW